MSRTLLSAILQTLLVFLSVSPASSHTAKLGFQDRVEAQEAIERVYHAHRLSDSRSFETATPSARIEQKVRRYLAQSVALEVVWEHPITAEMLDRELARIVRKTRSPDRLQELFGALGNDPVVVRECLARPLLVDRLSRQFFASDRRIHAETRRQADAVRARLVSGELSRSVASDREVFTLTRADQLEDATTDDILSHEDFRLRREALVDSARGVGPVRSNASVYIEVAGASDRTMKRLPIGSGGAATSPGALPGFSA